MTTDLPLNQRMSDTFKHVTSQLRDESDRGAVILAFAWMDEQLTQALKKFLLAPSNVGEKNDELFGIGRPISDAAAKIDLAYRLGLFSEQTYKSLQIVRRLRNDFAHLSSKLTFETDSVRERIVNLIALQQDMTEVILDSISTTPGGAQLLQEHVGNNSLHALSSVIGTKVAFSMLCGTIVCGLMFLTNHVSPISHARAASEE